MGGVIAGQPGVEVALAGGAQPEATGGEPVQQRDGGPDVPLDGDGLAVGDVLVAGAAPEPAQGVPGGVTVQQLPFAGIVTSGDDGRDPVFEADHVLVAGRQRAGGDQDAAQVPIVLLSGSSSRAAWVSGRWPAASSAKIAAAVFLFSQSSTVSGRSWPARLSCRACSRG